MPNIKVRAVQLVDMFSYIRSCRKCGIIGEKTNYINKKICQEEIEITRASQRAAAKYNDIMTEPAELMEFLMKKMATSHRAEGFATNRVVLVDNNIQTLYTYPLKPGNEDAQMFIKNKHEFRHHPMLGHFGARMLKR